MKNLLYPLVFAACFTLCGFDITGNGKALADIAIPEKPVSSVQFAAEELQKFIEHMSGVRLDIVSKNSPRKFTNRIHIGYGAVPADKHQFAWRIKAEKNDLYLHGNDREVKIPEGDKRDISEYWYSTPSGTLLAVYQFTDEFLKIRFVRPGDAGIIAPAKKTISVNNVDKEGHPRLVSFHMAMDRIVDPRRGGWRDMDYGRKFRKDCRIWLLRHGGFNTYGFPNGHAFTQYWKRFGKTNPEYFALLPDGTRRPLENDKNGKYIAMCISNPDFHDRIISDWRKRKSSSGKTPSDWLSVCENDIPGLCTCKNCRAWDAPEFAPQDDAYWNRKQIPVSRTRFSLLKIVEGEGNRVPSVSDRYCRFYMEMLKKASKYNPNVNLLAYAYANYCLPPKHIKLDPRIVIGYVGTPLFPMTPEKMAASKRAWNAWVATGCSLMYRPNSTHSQGCLPLQYTRQLAGEYRMALHTPGLKRVHFDALRGEFAAQGLMYYTIVRLTQHPEMTPEQIEDEYFSMFGKAEADVRKYHELWQKFSDSITMEDIRSWEKNTGMKYNLWVANDFFAEHIKPELFTESIKILNAAAEKADTARAKSETAFLLVGVKHAQLADKMLKAHIANLDAPSPEAARYLKKCQRELAAFRGKHEKLGISNMQLLNRREKRGLRLSQQRKKK